VLRDIEDTFSDNDLTTPGFVDKLALGKDEILNVILQSGVLQYTPRGFLRDFMETYPQHAADLWETARNNGYTGFDFLPPVTPVPTSTHIPGVPSPDHTITMVWSPGSDDLSGIDGYSYSLHFGTPLAPPTSGPTVVNGNNSYTSNTLTPGNWYFTLRAFDREGNFDPTYLTYGPMIIRTASPAELLPYDDPFGYWEYPVAPRSAPDATAFNIPAPTGVINRSTYWNAVITNTGEANTETGFKTGILVDGLTIDLRNRAVLTGFGGVDGLMNIGPVTMRGGRHVFAVDADHYEGIAEPDETNNDFGRQWIWNPEPFWNTATMDRASPPLRTGGWPSVSGQNLWYNCDGLRFIVDAGTGMFAGVMIQPDDIDDDFDIRMHTMASDANTGFAGNLAYSARPAGHIDAVFVNVNSRPDIAYDVGVINVDHHIDAGYHTEVLYAATLPHPGTMADSLALGETIKLFKFSLLSANQGLKSIYLSVDNTWNQWPVYMAWYDQNFTTGSLLDYDAVTVTDFGGYARLDVTVGAGVQGLVVWRDPHDGSLSGKDFTVRIIDRPPDMIPYQPLGWTNPMVPRASGNSTLVSAPLPTALPGDNNPTYVNYSYMNQSAAASNFFITSIRLDGAYVYEYELYELGAGIHQYVMNKSIGAVSGGRHAITMVIDPDHDDDELSEDNNTWGSQYVWQPQSLALDVPVSRSEPRKISAGWDRVTEDINLWYNCDGMRTPVFQPSGSTGYWGAVASLPAQGSDVDLRLHTVSTGVQDGFSFPLASSTWPPSESDFVLVNFNMTSTKVYDAGVLRGQVGSGGNYRLQATESLYGGTDPDGSLGAFQIDAGALLNLIEIQFTNPGHWVAELVPLFGSADLGFSLYGPADAVYTKSDVFDDGVTGAAIAWTAAVGATESMDFTITTPGYYCLAVWKAGSADADLTQSYRLEVVRQSASAIDIGGDVPAVTHLVGAYPNPFNPRTKVAFELAAAEHVRVEIFDLRGRLVRRLVDERLPAGRYERTWDGADTHGGKVSSGSYLLRMITSGAAQTARVTLLK